MLAAVSARRVDVAERRARLAARQRLTPARRNDDVVAMTDDLVALHATDPVTVYLSAAARMRTPALGPLDAALYEDRTLLRHHAMRRTLWVFGRETARLAHCAATVDVLPPQRRQLLTALTEAGVADPERWYDEAAEVICATLIDNGPLTGREVGQRLPELTLPLHLGGTSRFAATIAAHTRVLLVMGFEGRVLRARPTGSWINGQYRWAAAHAWVPGGIGEPLDRRSAAAGLARRCLRAFGPVTKADLQWWTRWTVATTTRALADVDAVEVDLDGATGFLLPDDLEPVPAPEPGVALLPGLDPSTMGWKQREFYLDPAHVPVLFDRNGNGGPTAWVDGRIVGGWAQRRDGTVVLRLLVDVGAENRVALERAAYELERLLGDVRFTPRFPAPLQAELLDA